MVNENKSEVPLKVTDVGNKIYVVEYYPSLPGIHTLTAYYGNAPILPNPLKIPVSPHVDPSAIRVDDFNKSKIYLSLIFFFFLEI